MELFAYRAERPSTLKLWTRSATSQEVVQLLEVINESTEELQGEEKVEKTELVDLVEETVEESLEEPQ